jgi:hypothetical protein
MCDAFNRGATDGIGRSEATTILPVPRENAKSGSGHAIKAQNRSTGVTKAIEVRERESKALVPVRILGLAGDHSEKVAVLELQTTVFSAVALRIRTNHLVPAEHVVSLGYPNSRLRFADGRFVEYGADKRFAGAALLETHDGNDRLVLVMAPRERPCWIAAAEWWQSSARSSRRYCRFRPVRCESRQPGKRPTRSPYPPKC